MEDLVEISSDSNDTIIITSIENNPEVYSENFYDLSIFEEKKTVLENINEGILGKSKQDAQKVIVADTEDYLLNVLDTRTLSKRKQNVDIIKDSGNLLTELHSKYLLPNVEAEKSYHDDKWSKKIHRTSSKRKLASAEDEDGNNLNPKMTKKQILELERNRRITEQQNKKELIEKEKAVKRTLKAIQKNVDPNECLKNITVEIDYTVLAKYGETITEKLKDNNISHVSVKNICDGLISWTRKVQTIENLIALVPRPKEKHFLLILTSSEFKSFVHTKSLNTHIHSISLQLKFYHLTIAVFGLDHLTSEQEYAVMEVEMFFKCYWQFVKKVDDLASLMFTITKAVAQIPYKLDKQEKYRLQNEYFADSKKDTVGVDKNGNGLNRLWNQMLTMLPLARLETAEAITSKYSTPSSLFKAYEECELGKEELLQNLPIRRANGPLAVARKIGPELSKKCAKFFTSVDNVYI